MVRKTISNAHTIGVNLTEINWRITPCKFRLSYEAGINKKISPSTEYEMYIMDTGYI